MRKSGLLITSIVLAVLVVCGVAWADTFSVRNTNDSGTGSLRAVINEANGHPGADVITFAPDARGTIGLKSALPELRGELEVRGPGASRLTVRRAAVEQFRVFEIADGAKVTLSGLRVANGQVMDRLQGYGGGIRSRGSSDLTLRSVVVSGNLAKRAGGGVYSNFSANLTVVNSTFSDNESKTDGGAINAWRGRVVRSTFSNNTADNGGAIRGGQTVVGSTFSNNSALGCGGALREDRGQVINSTFFENFAGNIGGGICLTDSVEGGSQAVTVKNSTITANSVDNKGGGLAVIGSPSDTIFNIEESIVAGNSASSSGAPDAHGTFVSSGYNLIGDTSGSSGFGGTDLTNTNPGLDTRGLRDNGGATQTIALVSSSPAIDAVEAGCPPPATDQRGVSRPQDGDGEGGALCDIGAYEREAPSSP